jgi:hypothetical protein
MISLVAGQRPAFRRIGGQAAPKVGASLHAQSAPIR